METLFYILVVLACLLSILNTVILVFIGIFLVNQRDQLKEFFSDLVNMIAGIEPVEPVVVKDDSRPKTWDEKYEEELEDMQRRMRAELGTGLKDLDEPSQNYNAPPAANPDAQEGLNLRSVKGNMLR